MSGTGSSYGEEQWYSDQQNESAVSLIEGLLEEGAVVDKRDTVRDENDEFYSWTTDS